LFEGGDDFFVGYEPFEFGASLLGEEGMKTSLGCQMHPGVDRVPANFVFSGYLGDFPSGPSFLDDGEFNFGIGVSVGHGKVYQIIKRGACQEKSVG
jgi:hypothetical protein